MQLGRKWCSSVGAVTWVTVAAYLAVFGLLVVAL